MGWRNPTAGLQQLERGSILLFSQELGLRGYFAAPGTCSAVVFGHHGSVSRTLGHGGALLEDARFEEMFPNRPTRSTASSRVSQASF
jgi:hypothetical protein